MRLLLITQVLDDSHPILGFMTRWVAAFSARVEALTVICLQEGAHAGVPAGVRVLSLGKESRVGRLRYLFRLYAYAIRERKRYDTVLVHMNQQYVLLCGLLWRVMGKRVALWYAHGHVPLSLRLALPLVDVVLTSTPSGFRLASPKVRVVGQGIDTALYAPAASRAPRREFRLISVGRLSPVKDYDAMIEATALLNGTGVPCTLRIIGGPGTGAQEAYAAALMQRAERRAPGMTRFVGPLDPVAVAAELRDADLFLNMSMTGSLDKAILEAMASGVPVVTCNKSATLLFAKRDGVRACLPGDVPSLRAEIAAFAALALEERAAQGAAARSAVVRNHALSGFVDRVIAALQQAD